MIRAVTVTNYLGESKRFELAFPEESRVRCSIYQWIGAEQSGHQHDRNLYE